MVLRVLIAAASLAALTAAFQPVTPTAIKMPIIAITIISSISENPRCELRLLRSGFINLLAADYTSEPNEGSHDWDEPGYSTAVIEAERSLLQGIRQRHVARWTSVLQVS